jgi:O-antigen/teichoic acid export membrane protein
VTQPPLRRLWTYSVADGIATAIALPGIIVVVRTLRVDEFGLADFLRTLQLLLTGVITTPLFDAAARFYFETTAEEERRRILGGALTAVIITGLGAALLLGASEALWAAASRLEIGSGAVWLTAVGVPANSLAMVVTQTAVLRGASRLYSVLVLTQACAGVAAILVLVVWAGAGLEGYLLAMAVAAAITTIAGYAFQARHYKVGRLAGPLKTYLAYGVPYTITGLVQHAHAVLIRVLLARFGSSAALAWYALAERIQAPLRLVISATGKVWLPWIFAAQPARHAPVGEAVFRLNGVVLGAQTLLIAFLPEAIRLLGGDDYAPAYLAALLLLVATWVHFLADWIVSSSLALAKDTKHRIVVHAVAAGLAMPIALVAIPRWGSAGAALSMLSASVVVLGGMLVVGSRVYPLNYGLRSLLPVSVLVVLSAIAASAQVHLGTKLLLICGGAAMWAVSLAQVRRSHTSLVDNALSQRSQA